MIIIRELDLQTDEVEIIGSPVQHNLFRHYLGALALGMDVAKNQFKLDVIATTAEEIAEDQPYLTYGKQLFSHGVLSLAGQVLKQAARQGVIDEGRLDIQQTLLKHYKRNEDFVLLNQASIVSDRTFTACTAPIGELFAIDDPLAIQAEGQGLDTFATWYDDTQTAYSGPIEKDPAAHLSFGRMNGSLYIPVEIIPKD